MIFLISTINLFTLFSTITSPRCAEQSCVPIVLITLGKSKEKKNCICESWPLVYGRYTCLTKLFCLALEQREMRHQKIKENRRWLKASSKGQGHLEMPAPIGSRSAAPSCEFATLSVFVRWLIGYLALLIFLFFFWNCAPCFHSLFIGHWCFPYATSHLLTWPNPNSSLYPLLTFTPSAYLIHTYLVFEFTNPD